jgi:hypothetical protein
MTTRNRNSNLQRRAVALAALGVASLALIAASPANAIYRSAETTSDEAPVIERSVNSDDNSPKQGCTLDVKAPDGSVQSSIKYPHGASFSAKNAQTGKTHTFTCNNGTWVETVSSTGPAGGGYIYEADNAYVDGSATLVFVNPHVEYTPSTDGAYYTEL